MKAEKDCDFRINDIFEGNGKYKSKYIFNKIYK